jgi:DNA mismatch endonuclease, patch repair protein
LITTKQRKRVRTATSFVGLQPSSKRASIAARAASAKRNTRCELVLRRELWRRGYRYRLHVSGVPGRPDIVFRRQRVAIFCDGDFWHGRDLENRLAKLMRGHNSAYWTAKIQRNVERDRQNTAELKAAGWDVLRFWETDVLRDTLNAADRIAGVLSVKQSHTYLRSARKASIDSGGL